MSPSILVALPAGLMLPFQAVFNARLGRMLGLPIWAASVSGAVTTVALGFAAVPWWAWTGDLCGVVALLGMTTAAPAMIAAIVSSQVVLSTLLDHFGLFGLPVHPLTPRRLMAACLLLGGAVLTF